MNYVKKIIGYCVICSGFGGGSCGGGDKQAQTTIKVGATAGPHAEVVELQPRKRLKVA